MATLSVIPGAASVDRLSALVIARDARAEPIVRVQSARGVAQASVPRAPGVVARSPDLARALRDARVIVRRFEVTIANAPAEGTKVRIDVTVDGLTQTLRLDTLPRSLPEEGLSFIVASCFDAQFKMGEKLRAALDSELAGHPSARFQLWVGDNVYLDVPGFSSENLPYAQTLQRYLEYFLGSSYAEARRLHPNFTTYDDHELWNDYPEEQFQLPRSREPERAGYERAALECLELFQSNLNMNRVSDAGLSFRIDFDEVSIFVADTRTRRDPASAAASGKVPMMAAEELNALEAWCRDIWLPKVLVLGQPLWMAPVDTTAFGGVADHNPPFFRAQYERIWRALRQSPYDVLVVSGDIHYSRLMQLSMYNAANRNVFELVTSPASEIPTLFSTIGEFVFGTEPEQDRVSAKAPSVVAGSAQNLKARCLFGTTSPNSFARVTLSRLGSSAVKVGVSFVEYTRGPAALARAETIEGVPKLGTKNYAFCDEPSACVLRMR